MGQSLAPIAIREQTAASGLAAQTARTGPRNFRIRTGLAPTYRLYRESSQRLHHLTKRSEVPLVS